MHARLLIDALIGIKLVDTLRSDLNLRGSWSRGVTPYVFCELAKDLPYLGSLSLSISTDKVEYIDAERNIFGNLRQLDLVLRHHIEFNLLNVTLILEACPLLVKFHLGVCDLGWYRRSSMFQQIFNIMMKRLTTKEGRVERTPICHKHLEEVKLGGFVGTQNEVEVALFFLRSAVALNRMLISSTFKYSSGNGIYNFHCMHPFSEAVREMFHRELYRQAVSPTAKVIIWDGRLYTL